MQGLAGNLVSCCYELRTLTVRRHNIPDCATLCVRGVWISTLLEVKFEESFKVIGSHTAVRFKHDVKIRGGILRRLEYKKAFNAVIIEDLVGDRWL